MKIKFLRLLSFFALVGGISNYYGAHTNSSKEGATIEKNNAVKATVPLQHLPLQHQESKTNN